MRISWTLFWAFVVSACITAVQFAFSTVGFGVVIAISTVLVAAAFLFRSNNDFREVALVSVGGLLFGVFFSSFPDLHGVVMATLVTAYCLYASVFLFFRDEEDVSSIVSCGQLFSLMWGIIFSSWKVVFFWTAGVLVLLVVTLSWGWFASKRSLATPSTT